MLRNINSPGNEDIPTDDFPCLKALKIVTSAVDRNISFSSIVTLNALGKNTGTYFIKSLSFFKSAVLTMYLYFRTMVDNVRPLGFTKQFNDNI